MKVHKNGTKFSLLINEIAKIFSSEHRDRELYNISIHFSDSSELLLKQEYYSIEYLSNFRTILRLSTIDISKIKNTLSNDEIISIIINRFVKGLLEIKNINIDLKVDYEKSIALISKYLLGDHDIHTACIDFLSSQDNLDYNKLQIVINKKLKLKSSIIDISHIKNHDKILDMQSLFTSFNNEVLDIVINNIHSNKTDYLLRFNKPNIFIEDREKQLAAISKPMILLGLVISKIDHFREKNEVEDITFNDVINELTNDVFNDANKSIDEKINSIESTSSKIERLKAKIDIIPLPITFTSEKSYLNLDKQYLSHQKHEYGHTVNRDQVLQNYRNNKKRTHSIFHSISHKNLLLANNKSVTLSDGIITLGYWRIYYYKQKLYKDLNSLEREQDLGTIINIFFRYFTFIEYDLKVYIYEYFDILFEENKNKTKVNMDNIYYKINEIESLHRNTKEKTLEKYKVQYDTLVEMQENSLKKLSEMIPELISLHFNQVIIEKIISEYAYAIGNHELILTHLFKNDKDITDLL